MTTLHLKKSIGRAALRRGFPAILRALALGLFAVPQLVPAVTPAPDGGYPNGNTAEGDSALFSLSSGNLNTAIGFNALYSDTTGNYNTANGGFALSTNIDGSYNTATGYAALACGSGDRSTATGYAALYGGGSNSTAIWVLGAW